MTTAKSIRRKALGATYITAFLLLQSIANYTLDADADSWQDLSEKEKLYVDKLKKRLNHDADKVREFGHHLGR